MKKRNKVDIRNFLRTDRAMLIICICIALVFWIFVKLSQSYKSAIPVSINYILPEGKTILKSPPQIVQATLEGTGWDLMSNYFYGNKIVVDFNLSSNEIQTINQSSIVSKIYEQLSKNIEVDHIDLDAIYLQIENDQRKRIAVRIPIDNNINPGFTLKAPIQVGPDSIEISGPISLLNEIHYWPTEDLNLNEIKGPYSENISLVVPDNKQIKLMPPFVKVALEIEQLTEKSFFIPITKQNAPDSIKIFPERVKLSFVTGLSKFKTLNMEDFKAVVDLAGFNTHAENNTIPIQLKTKPSSIENVSISPKSVEFFIVK